MLPAAALFIVLAQPMLGVLVRGSFHAHDAAVTADTLQVLAIGLVSFSVYLYTLRGFYALQNTFKPFWINAIENGANIALAIVLFPSLGVQGLAYAWSGAYTIAAVLAVVVLGRKVPKPIDRQVWIATGRAVLATAALAIVAAVLVGAIGHPTANRAFVATAVAGLAGSAAYVLVLVLLRTPELGQLLGVLRRRAITVDV
jgi:putative peptidoglycan lipid II flippase